MTVHPDSKLKGAGTRVSNEETTPSRNPSTGRRKKLDDTVRGHWRLRFFSFSGWNSGQPPGSRLMLI
jgi:hypothetical protein